MTVRQTIEAQEDGDNKRNGEMRVLVNEMDISLCEMSDEEEVIEGLRDEDEGDLNDDSMIIDEEEIEVDSKTDTGIDLNDSTEEIVKTDSTEEIDSKDVEIVTIEETEVVSVEEVIEVASEEVTEVSEEIVEVEAVSEILETMIVLNVKPTKDPKVLMTGVSQTQTVNPPVKSMEAGDQLLPKT